MPIHSPFLRYLHEVRQCGSIRRAARKLHVASSAVNQQILKVEAELGTKLFHRSPTGMILTEAGELLAEHVDKTLAQAELLVDQRDARVLSGLHVAEDPLLSVDDYLASIRLIDTGQDLHQRALARAVLANDPEHLTRADLQVDLA